MEWIKLEYKKPPNGWMLIAYKYYADPNIICSDFGLHLDGEFTTDGIKRDVTHWMFLPEAPKEFYKMEKDKQIILNQELVEFIKYFISKYDQHFEKGEFKEAQHCSIAIFHEIRELFKE